MKASEYHLWEDDPVLDKVAEYAYSTPMSDDSFDEVDWVSEDDRLLCIDAIEDEFECEFSDEELASMFDGDMKMAELSIKARIFEKVARISTAKEKAQAKQYRMQNKAKIQRASNIRKAKIQSGAHRVRKRVGSAAGGFSFVQAPPSSGGGNSGSSSVHKSVSMSTGTNYSPMANTSSTAKRTSLIKQAEKRLLALGMENEYKRSFNKRAALEMARNNLPQYMEELRVGMEYEYDGDWDLARKHAIDKMSEDTQYYTKLAFMSAGEPITNPENPIAGKMGFPPKPSTRSQVKIKKPNVPEPPKIKASNNPANLPSGKVNAKLNRKM